MSTSSSESIWRNVLPASFKEHVLTDPNWLIQTSNQGLDGVLNVRESVDPEDLFLTNYSQALLIENSDSLGVMFRRNNSKDPWILQMSKGPRDEMLRFEASDKSTHQFSGEGEITCQDLVKALRGEIFIADPFRVRGIQVPPFYRQYFSPPVICEADFLLCSTELYPDMPHAGVQEIRTEFSFKGMFSRFETAESGGHVWVQQVQGSQVLFVVPGKKGDMDFMRTWERGRIPSIPHQFNGRILAIHLEEGNAVTFPGHWAHANLTIRNSVTQGGIFFAVPMVHEYLRFNELDRSLAEGEPNQTLDMRKIVSQALPMFVREVFRLTSLPAMAAVVTKVLDALNGLTDLKDEPGLQLINGLPHAQNYFQNKYGQCLHVSGAVYNKDMANTIMRYRNEGAGTLLTNVLAGNTWRFTMSSKEGDPDFCNNHIEEEKFKEYSTPEWYGFQIAPCVRLVEASATHLKAVANRRIDCGGLIGDYRGEVLTCSDLKLRYGSRSITRRVRVLTAWIGKENEFLGNVYIDAGRMGGVNHFMPQDDRSPNCETRPLIVDNCIKLGIFAVRIIELNEDLILQPNPFISAPLWTKPALSSKITLPPSPTLPMDTVDGTESELTATTPPPSPLQAVPRPSNPPATPTPTTDKDNKALEVIAAKKKEIERRRPNRTQFETAEEYTEWNNDRINALGDRRKGFFCTDEECQMKEGAFKTKSVLDKHMRLWHTPYPLMCGHPGCYYGGTNRYDIERHERRHPGWETLKSARHNAEDPHDDSDDE